MIFLVSVSLIFIVRSGDVLESPSLQRSIALTVENGRAFDNQPDDNGGVQTTLIESEASLLPTKQTPHEYTRERAAATQHPHTVEAAQDTDRINALVESHYKARALERRLKEINREQDMILRELHELITVVVQ